MRKIKEPDTEPFFKSVDDFIEGKTIEELITDRFIPYYGLTEQEIISKLKIDPPVGKNRVYFIAKSIMGLKRRKIEEFEKADIQFKTIRLEQDGNVKRDLQFSQILYKEIVNENWNESAFNQILESKFFFIFFQIDGENLVLKKAKFWNMPYEDRQNAKRLWNYAKNLIAKGKIVKDIKDNGQRVTYFPDKIYSYVAHVRPHGRDTDGTYPLPVKDNLTKATEYRKQSFWLNNSYVKDHIYLK